MEPRGKPSLLGEVLRIAEDYSTLLRVYQRRISPVDALGAMARAAGRFYHPVLMQVMINRIGRYPPGTLLELEDGRRVRSISPVRSPETFANPLVREVSEDAAGADRRGAGSGSMRGRPERPPGLIVAHPNALSGRWPPPC